MNPRRLYRSRDRMLAGVAGGMAEYLDIDPTVIRILWVIIGIASGGFALIAYVILALVMPQAPYATGAWGPAPAASGPTGPIPGAAAWGAPSAPPAPIGGWDAAPSAGAPAGTSSGAAYAGPYPGAYPGYVAQAPYAPARSQGRGIGVGAIVGVVLVVVGVIALADAALPGWVAGAILGPAVILTLGAALLASSLRRRDDAPAAPTATSTVAASPAAPAPFSSAPTTGEAPAAAATPEPPMAPATPWDVTDTQAVDPFASSDANEGTRPA